MAGINLARPFLFNVNHLPSLGAVLLPGQKVVDLDRPGYVSLKPYKKYLLHHLTLALLQPSHNRFSALPPLIQ